jgi:hypothetical protein
MEGGGEDSRRFPRRRHREKGPTDAQVKRRFLRLTEGEPSKEELAQVHEMIGALSAVEDMEQAYRQRQVKELEKMVGLGGEENKLSFTEKEEARGTPPNSNERK